MRLIPSKETMETVAKLTIFFVCTIGGYVAVTIIATLLQHGA